MKPAKKKKKKRKEKEKKKATTFLIFQDYKKITIISYKVIIVIPNTITHTNTAQYHWSSNNCNPIT